MNQIFNTTLKLLAVNYLKDTELVLMTVTWTNSYKKPTVVIYLVDSAVCWEYSVTGIHINIRFACKCLHLYD